MGANIDDHSHIVSFVSPFMADTLMGISRLFEFMNEIYPPTPYSGNKNEGYHSHAG